LWNFSKISTSQHYPHSLQFFQNYYKCPFYFLSSYHLPRLIILFFLNKVVGTSIIKIWIENYVWGKGKNHQWFEFALLKKRRGKDVKKDPNSVANGRFHCLVAFGRFHWLTALERVHCLVANGRWKRNTFSFLPTSSQQILLKLSIFFPLTLKSYFTMVLSRYLRISFLFFELYITTTHLDVTSLPHIHCWFDFDWRFDFFPFLEIMMSRMVTFYGPQTAQVNEEPPPESFLNLTLT
jgi:hypothetical protein